ncbi:hypothetical protein C8Q74DRAFT_1018680 [Fomes fomentarius]|nr:hypothetical protein C8Q74DRAFT_1018680 [Fomes fomentarius]
MNENHAHAGPDPSILRRVEQYSLAVRVGVVHDRCCERSGIGCGCVFASFEGCTLDDRLPSERRLIAWARTPTGQVNRTWSISNARWWAQTRAQQGAVEAERGRGRTGGLDRRRGRLVTFVLSRACTPPCLFYKQLLQTCCGRATGRGRSEVAVATSTRPPCVTFAIYTYQRTHSNSSGRRGRRWLAACLPPSTDPHLPPATRWLLPRTPHYRA